MTPREAMRAMPPMLPHYAVHCEMQDVAARATAVDALNAPACAALELAKLLTRFDTSIDDDWRATPIGVGGICIRLSNELDKAPHEAAHHG